MDRISAKATPEGTLNYTYDAAGHVASIASSNANGASMSYTYDDLNRLGTVVDNRLNGGTTTYSYDNASNVATVTYPNGVQSTFSYDTLNRVTVLSSQPASYTYQRGPTGNLTQAQESSGRTVNWSYDGIYRLTNETISLAPSQNNGSASYGLDPVGNRLNESSSLPDNPSGSWNFNSDDELSSETYDSNGNVTSTGGKAFTYDSENHLISMTASATSASIVYDAFGNRVAKTVNGVTTSYLVEDNKNPTGYPQVFDELTNGAVTRTYTYGLQRIDEDQVLNGAWTPSYYGYDGGGNVRQLTNTAGTVTDSYEYDAFGNHWTVQGSTPNNMLYQGEEWDPDLSLLYLRARYMNPLTGRFMSRDPLDGDLTDPETLHKYLYAHGDPVNELDPSGMASIPYPAPAPAQTRPVRSASEYAGIILNIAIRAIPAVAAVGCAVNIQYTVDALRTPGGSMAAIKLDLPECSAHKDCEPYEERIQAELDNVIGRYNELLADIHGLYGVYCRDPKATTQWGSWESHLEAFDNAKFDLQSAIADARDAGCPVSAEAEEWAIHPPPICPGGKIPKQ